MRLLEQSADSGGGGEGGGGDTAAAVVVVGVKMDSQSKELLTWALVKVAHPGDRVVALHVLDTSTESKSSLLSLVNKFDSVLAVYEGFCNLKQVDLKLKVCRGSSVKKSLVEEARSYDGAKVIVGSSKCRHTIRSSVSVAKYCARKLSRSFCVYAVDNGKVLFQREAVNVNEACDVSGCVREDKLNADCRQCLQRSCSGCKRDVQRRICKVCSSSSLSSDGSGTREELDRVDKVGDSLAMVPYDALAADSSSDAITSGTSSGSRYGWAFLRQVFVPKWRQSEISSPKNPSVIQRVLKLPFHSSSSVVYPDQKQNKPGQHEGQCSEINGNKGAIVPVGQEASSPHQSCDDEFYSLPGELEGLHEKYTATCRLLSYQDVLSATSNFAPENLIGRGGSSNVYRGCLSDGKELALKIFKPSKEVLKEFVSEIEIITTLHHKNIISLFGFCYEDNNLLIAYDYLSRGSLEENLHGKKSDAKILGWQERLKVAIGIAEALDYLHNGCDEPVIHKDVKSSNILLFDDFEPQLSDFGLANRPSNASSSYVTSTDVAGTFGYLAPEYFMHGKVSDKIDVYAFGIVLLELLSGRKPIDREQPKGQESLVMWAKPKLEVGKVLQLLDTSLGSDYDCDQIERMALASNLCIRRSPKLRPQMNFVLKLLQGDEEAMKWAKQRVEAFDEVDDMDGEVIPPTNIQSHLSIALQDLDDDSLSPGSVEQTVSVEDYLNGRWSRTSSFD